MSETPPGHAPAPLHAPAPSAPVAPIGKFQRKVDNIFTSGAPREDKYKLNVRIQAMQAMQVTQDTHTQTHTHEHTHTQSCTHLNCLVS
jgi:hypothetical protein